MKSYIDFTDEELTALLKAGDGASFYELLKDITP